MRLTIAGANSFIGKRMAAIASTQRNMNLTLVIGTEVAWNVQLVLSLFTAI